MSRSKHMRLMNDERAVTSQFETRTPLSLRALRAAAVSLPQAQKELANAVLRWVLLREDRVADPAFDMSL